MTIQSFTYLKGDFIDSGCMYFIDVDMQQYSE